MTTMRRGRARPRVARRTRAKTSWENLAFVASLGVVTNIVIADLTPEPIQTVTGDVGTATLRRAILHFDFMQPTTNATNIQLCSVGIYVVSHEGFDGGAVSDPEADFFQDWYYWTRRGVARTGNTVGITSWDADIRSMRKLRGGYKLAFIVSHPLNDVATELHTSMRLLWSQP